MQSEVTDLCEEKVAIPFIVLSLALHGNYKTDRRELICIPAGKDASIQQK